MSHLLSDTQTIASNPLAFTFVSTSFDTQPIALAEKPKRNINPQLPLQK